MQRGISLFLIILCIIGIKSQAQEYVFNEEFKKNIEKRVQDEIITGIVIGVVTPEGTSYYSHGVKSLKTKEPVDEHTVFEIGSITKNFTSVLLANEVINGELSLDDPLQKLLPDGVTAPTRNGQSINLKHLANHSSSLPGIPNNLSPGSSLNRYSNYTKKQLYDMINSYELTHDIGSKFGYSNLGMGLLGTVLAEKNNLGYEDLVLKIIAEPLKMKNTRITLSPEMEKEIAQGHSSGDEIGSWRWEYHTLAGAGALNSTAVDMLKYLAANMGIEKSELYPAMKLSHKYSGSGQGEMIKAGLGWFTTDIEGVDVIWHDGGTSGYMSFAGFSKDGKKGVVILTNSTGFPDDIGFHLLNPKYELANPLPSIVTKLNKIIKKEGIESAIKTYKEIKENHASEYHIDEHQFLRLGYRYMKESKTMEAVAVLKICVETYPESWNAYNYYADALRENNDNEKAIENYRKSLEFNPENSKAIENLKKLGVEINNPEK